MELILTYYYLLVLQFILINDKYTVPAKRQHSIQKYVECCTNSETNIIIYIGKITIGLSDLLSNFSLTLLQL